MTAATVHCQVPHLHRQKRITLKAKRHGNKRHAHTKPFADVNLVLMIRVNYHTLNIFSV